MAMKARYTVVNGEVIAEKRDGVRKFYVPDGLGSTVALLDNTQAKTDTFGYRPYGEESSRTGTTPTPFQFVGSLGYYRDNSTRTYVRARHYQPAYGRWISRDPRFEPKSDGTYNYADDGPTNNADYSGLQASRPGDAYVFCSGWRFAECEKTCRDQGGIHWCTETYRNGRLVGWGCECRQKVKPPPPPKRCDEDEWAYCLELCLRQIGVPIKCVPEADGRPTCWCTQGPYAPYPRRTPPMA